MISEVDEMTPTSEEAEIIRADSPPPKSEPPESQDFRPIYYQADDEADSQEGKESEKHKSSETYLDLPPTDQLALNITQDKVVKEEDSVTESWRSNKISANCQNSSNSWGGPASYLSEKVALSARQPPESRVKMQRDDERQQAHRVPSDIYMKDSVDGGVGCCCGSSCMASGRRETPKNTATDGNKIVWKKDYKTKSRLVWRAQGEQEKEEEKEEKKGKAGMRCDNELVRKRGGSRRASEHAQPKQGFRSTPRSNHSSKCPTPRDDAFRGEYFTKKVFELNEESVQSSLLRQNEVQESRGNGGVFFVRPMQQSTFFETFETAAAGEAGLAMLLQATSSEDTKYEGKRNPFGELNESQIEHEIRCIEECLEHSENSQLKLIQIAHELEAEERKVRSAQVRNASSQLEDCTSIPEEGFTVQHFSIQSSTQAGPPNLNSMRLGRATTASKNIWVKSPKSPPALQEDLIKLATPTKDFCSTAPLSLVSSYRGLRTPSHVLVNIIRWPDPFSLLRRKLMVCKQVQQIEELGPRFKTPKWMVRLEDERHQREVVGAPQRIDSKASTRKKNSKDESVHFQNLETVQSISCSGFNLACVLELNTDHPETGETRSRGIPLPSLPKQKESDVKSQQPTISRNYKENEKQFSSSENSQLSGSDDFLRQMLPQRVIRELSENVMSWISCGFQHIACLTQYGAVFSWGFGGSGCLGHGSYVSYSTPKQITTLTNKPLCYVECGGYHTGGLSPEGEVFVWGRGDIGQLGLPRAALTEDVMGLACLQPSKLAIKAKISSLALGEAHTLLLDSDGYVLSAGWGQVGQLGQGEAERALQFRDIGLEKIQRVASGSVFSVAVDEQHQLYVWGSNQQGQLGIGADYQSLRVPTALEVFSQKGELERIMDIIAGDAHVLVICESGKVYGWGQGVAGDCFEKNDLQDSDAFSSESAVPLQLVAGDSSMQVMQKYKQGTQIICYFPQELCHLEVNQRLILHQEQLLRTHRKDSKASVASLCRPLFPTPSKRIDSSPSMKVPMSAPISPVASPRGSVYLQPSDSKRQMFTIELLQEEAQSKKQNTASKHKRSSTLVEKKAALKNINPKLKIRLSKESFKTDSDRKLPKRVPKRLVGQLRTPFQNPGTLGSISTAVGNIKDSGIVSASSYLKEANPLSKSVVARRNSPQNSIQGDEHSPLYLNNSPTDQNTEGKGHMRHISDINGIRAKKLRGSIGQSSQVRTSQGGSEIGVNPWKTPSSVSSAESRLLRLEEQLKEKEISKIAATIKANIDKLKKKISERK